MVWILVSVLIMYAAGLIAMSWISLHPPRIPLFCSPGAIGAPQEEIRIESEPGIELVGWWVEAENPRAVAILAHGYAMNRAELAPLAFQLWRSGVSCLLFDFRAHGKSRGAMSTIGLREKEDVAAAVHFAKNRCAAPVVLIGSSMGSAASALALGEDLSLAHGLILDSSYSKLSNAIPGWWRFLGGLPLQILLWPVMPMASIMAKINPYKVDVAEALSRLESTPVLVLHGEKDDLAPASEAERNLAALPAGTRAVWFAGCGHTEGRWLLPELYWAAVAAFIERVVLENPGGNRPPGQSKG